MMEKSKKIVIALFTITITSIAIYLNWDNSLMGTAATSFNMVVTTIYLLSWVLFSFCWGVIKDFRYYKFMLIYWGIHLFCFVLVTIAKDMASLIIPLMIWFGSPSYGLEYFYDFPNRAIDNIACGIIPFILNIMGFWGGVLISGLLLGKQNKSKENKQL